jgi:hypothetical protein
MEIKNFVKIYDEVLPWNTLSNLIRFANIVDFTKTQVGGADGKGVVDFNIRKTYASVLSNNSSSLSNVHWFNLLGYCFLNNINKYKTDLNILHLAYKSIFDIEILKYENQGFYKWHVDHFAEIPRTISCILLLNNDYEGGNLCFRNPDGSEEWEVEVKPNRMIIWPSNFLYPHTVKPVTKGRRYSVVAWAL